MLLLHLAAWLAILVTLWVTSPRGRAEDVLFTFTNGGGWSSAGVATLIGLITAWSSILGYDSSVHMTLVSLSMRSETHANEIRSENAKDASRTIPSSLMTAFVVNALLAFAMVITMVFCAGDLEQDLADPNLTPVCELRGTCDRCLAHVLSAILTVLKFIIIFLNSTRSRAATVVMTLPLLLTGLSALIGQVATASRQLWSFARVR